MNIDFAYIDSANQVMAMTSSPHAPDPTYWETKKGYTRIEIPAGIECTRDVKLIVTDGVVVGTNASTNPVQPVPPTYDKLRAAAYPSIGDQLDMQYHDGVDGTTTWADAIAAVKAKYAKP